jgi:hypothetical protein
MLSKAAVVSGNNSTLSSVIGALFPRRPQHRIAFSVAIICLISLVICITLTIYAQGNRVLLVSSTAAVQQPERTDATTPVASTSAATQGTINASQALTRIAQAEVSQYASQAEHDQWWASTCSATSLTEVINSYGHQYRITDILKVESSIGAISPENGLLYGNGIDQTAIWFGFETTTLNNPTLDQVIETANKGQPVIVSFPPQPGWTGGHILVVRGGDNATVKLADSSNYNLQTVTRAYFSKYWRGFAKVLSPSRYIVTSKPTVTVAAINNMLAAHHSPVAGQGQMIYDTALKYGLDPAYIVATFAHESNFGTRGEATKSKSPGNLRCIQNAGCADGYAQFATWQAGFEALCNLLAGSLYVKDGRIVPETIIPRFAPAADSNDEGAYIAALKHVMDVLRAGKTSI